MHRAGSGKPELVAAEVGRADVIRVTEDAVDKTRGLTWHAVPAISAQMLFLTEQRGRFLTRVVAGEVHGKFLAAPLGAQSSSVCTSAL